MRRLIRLAIAAVPMLGCKPELPSLDFRGERVRVGSDLVDQVCAGTLARMDREVEQIETRLDLPIQESRLDVYVVDHDMVDAYCGGAANCAARHGDVYFVVVDYKYFERAIAHELVHTRLLTGSVPLFNEGIAEAASHPSCPRPAPDVDLAEILAAKRSLDLPDRSDTYYASGELVAWLLEEFGPLEVLSLIRSIDRGSSPAAIEAKYLEHFDRDLADDFLAHRRTTAELDALPPENFGCFAPFVDPSQGPARLVADLDCDSDRVQNLFGLDGRGYVEWTLTVEHEQTLEVDGVVPFGTGLTIEPCGCQPKLGDQSLLARPFDTREILQPGIYRLRWIGELEEGLSLDVELVPVED